MSTAEQILAHLSVGACVVVKRKDNQYCVFSPLKDNFGDFRCSGFEPDIKGAKVDIGKYMGLVKGSIEDLSEEDNWQIVETYYLPLQPFKVGDRVRVRENAKEECEKWGYDWHEEKSKMVGGIFELVGLYSGNYNVANCAFPHSALELVFKNPDPFLGKTATLKLNGKEYEVEVKGVK